jgi:hypothetical protein
MPIPAKPKIKKNCANCGKEFFVRPCKHFKYKAKFCSNRCKWDYKKLIPSKRRTPREKIILCTCSNVFCKKQFYLKPYQLNVRLRKSPNIFCSHKCFLYFRTKKYQLDIERLRQVQQIKEQRRIWRL